MTIEQRLEKLERTVRRYQLAFGVLGLALLATIAVSCSRPALAGQQNAAIPKVIRARRFEVINRDGTRAMVLTSGEDKNPLFAGLLNKGELLWLLSGDKTGGGRILLDDGTRKAEAVAGILGIVQISAAPKVGGRAHFQNVHRKEAVYIGTDKTNQGLVTVSDVNGRVKDALPRVGR